MHRGWGRGDVSSADASHGPRHGLDTMPDLSNAQPGQKGRKRGGGWLVIDGIGMLPAIAGGLCICMTET